MNQNVKNHRYFMGIFFLVSFILFIYLLRDFLLPIFLSSIFAGLFYPMFTRLTDRFKGKKGFASVVVLLLVLLLIVLPILFVLSSLINEVGDVTSAVEKFVEEQSNPATQMQLSVPSWLTPYVDPATFQQDLLTRLNNLTSTIGGMVFNGITALTQSTFVFVLNLFIFMYSMYYFLNNSKSVIESARFYLPFTSNEFDMLSKQILSISRATLKGAVLIGLIQGSLVGLAFWATGLPAPIFWTLVTSIFALIPSLGTGFIYIPAGIYLLSIGHTAGGVGMLLWGFFVVGLIDNFLRPVLVGKDAELPDLLVLVSTLGGISIFGLSGIVIGPLIAGVFISMLKIYKNSEE